MVSIGIHIQKHSFHVVELSLNGGVLALENAYERTFDSAVTEEKRNISILEYLKSLEDKYKDQTFRFCFGLSQDEVSSFFIEFPFKERFKILKTLPFEIADKSPFNVRKIFYYGKITRLIKNRSSVICFIAPEHHVKKFLQLVKPLKTDPYLLSVEGSALANIVQGSNFSSSHQIRLDKPTLYIYMDYYQSVVLVFKEGHLNSVSHLDWGFYPIIKQMEKKYKLTFEKSVEQFFDKSFILTSDKGFTSEQVAFSNLIKKQINLFIDQLKLLKLSLETDNQIRFDEMVIYGLGSTIKNLSSFLSLKMDARISKMKTVPDLPSLDLRSSKNQSCLVASGLAIEGLKRPPYEGVNFIHGFYKESFSLFPSKWKSALAFISILIIFFSSYSLLRYEKSSSLLNEIESIFSDYGKKIALLRASQVNPEKIKEFLKGKEDLMLIEQMIKKEKAKSNPIDYIKKLTEGLDLKEDWDFKIKTLTIKNRKITISGEINDPFDKDLQTYFKKVSTQFKVRESESVVVKKDKKTEPVQEKLALPEKQKSILGKDLPPTEKEEVPDIQEQTIVKFQYEFIIKEGA